QREFKRQWGNQQFRKSKLTYLALFFLMVLYPGASLLFAEDPATLFKDLDQIALLAVLISTLFVQWAIFLLIYLTTYREETGLAGLGFRRLRLIHLAWTGAFLLATFSLLTALTFVLAELGLPLSGEIALIVPQDTLGRTVWVLTSITAGICEETAFRGYLMTRIRLLAGFKSWLWPVVISSVIFGVCHYSYQGLPGLVIITVYGLLLALLYIYTRSLWPPIIAHFFQDFSALFIPQ
ncbi:MAG: type II CAAX endopeptidase family protein, partial [Candidatus Zixiibacteriota bacterium]